MARFTREARVVARLNHPNIVRVLDIESDENLNIYYFVIEYIEERRSANTYAKRGRYHSLVLSKSASKSPVPWNTRIITIPPSFTAISSRPIS